MYNDGAPLQHISNTLGRSPAAIRYQLSHPSKRPQELNGSLHPESIGTDGRHADEKRNCNKRRGGRSGVRRKGRKETEKEKGKERDGEGERGKKGGDTYLE
jgi:hypothetical protein